MGDGEARIDLAKIAEDWQQLAEADPLWAVYVAPGTKGGRWDADAFFETGRREVDRVLSDVAQRGLPNSWHTALDFGCGVGRLSQALATRFSKVLAIDVSPTMLERAAEFDRSDGRIEFILNEDADLACVASGSVDLVYSSLVLQHLARPLAAGYLAEFVRVLAPGGVAVVQVASGPTWSVKGWLGRILPASVVGWLQTRFLGYPAPMRMEAMPDSWVQRHVDRAAAVVIDRQEDPSYAGHWRYRRYLITKSEAQRFKP